MSTLDYFNVTHNAIQNYINNGNINIVIRNNNCSQMPIIKFVSFDRDGVLKVLIAGKCPSCGSKHIRNVCNVRYCKEVIDPILKSKFSTFSFSVPVLTHDPDLESIVTTLGGTLFYPVNHTTKLSFDQHEKFMLDFHPDVDAHVKMMSLKNDRSRPYEPTELVDMNQMLKKYNFMFVILDSTKTVSTVGELLVGSQINEKKDSVLPGFILNSDSNVGYLFTNGDLQYKPKNFVVIEF